jgi:hypothetical protein
MSGVFVTCVICRRPSWCSLHLAGWTCGRASCPAGGEGAVVIDRGQEHLRRCSFCGISYPDLPAHARCGVCEQGTARMPGEPDADWEERARLAALSAPADRARDPRLYRMRRYLSMGFDRLRAETLADAKYGEPTLPLHWARVQDAIDAGCDHDTAYDAFA